MSNHRGSAGGGAAVVAACGLLLFTGCKNPAIRSGPSADRARSTAGATRAAEPEAANRPGEPEAAADRAALARTNMVRDQIAPRGIRDPAVLAAMEAVPRHRFVPAGLADRAYQDRPLPIGHDQTISQPYIVALMTDLADVNRGSKVLEIGTGSGYQAAVLAELGAKVYSIEIVEPLGRQAAALLQQLGYEVETRIGDGYRGWPEAAPFDAILVTAAPPEVPKALEQQLAVGGRLVIPVGEVFQELLVITRTKTGFQRRRAELVRFVPMTGEAQKQ